MSRIRTIKPSFFLDEDLARLPPLDRLVFAGLWTQADKAGRLEDRPQRLRVQLLPYDDGNFEAILQRLHDAGFICRYEAESGVKLIQVSNFAKHQRPHHTEPDSLYPPCLLVPARLEHGAATVKQPLLDGEAPDGREGKGREGKEYPPNPPKGGPRVRMAPPTADEVRTFAAEKGLTLDPEYFVDAYAQKGWMAGKVPMKDWKAAARNAARDGWTMRGRNGGKPEARVVIHKNQTDLDREREGDEIARNRAAATRAREEREAAENGWGPPDTPEERAESERLLKIREAQLAAEKADS